MFTYKCSRLSTTDRIFSGLLERCNCSRKGNFSRVSYGMTETCCDRYLKQSQEYGKATTYSWCWSQALMMKITCKTPEGQYLCPEWLTRVRATVSRHIAPISNQRAVRHGQPREGVSRHRLIHFVQAVTNSMVMLCMRPFVEATCEAPSRADEN